MGLSRREKEREGQREDNIGVGQREDNIGVGKFKGRKMKHRENKVKGKIKKTMGRSRRRYRRRKSEGG
jgi:hypothetical protein